MLVKTKYIIIHNEKKSQVFSNYTLNENEISHFRKFSITNVVKATDQSHE